MKKSITHEYYVITQITLQDLGYTTPVVIYGLFRYLFLLYQKKQGEDPVTDLFHDRQILVTMLIWGVMTAALVI